MDVNDFDEEIIAEVDEVLPSANSFGVLEFLQSNGWYILILSLLLYYVWKNKISSQVEKWRKNKEISDEAVNVKKDSDLYSAREAARLAAVQKLQESYNEQALKMKKIAEEKEERKRQEFIQKNSTIGGRKLNEDYNPLMGKGGPTYRAPRPTCPGGSCGNR